MPTTRDGEVMNQIKEDENEDEETTFKTESSWRDENLKSNSKSVSSQSISSKSVKSVKNPEKKTT